MTDRIKKLNSPLTWIGGKGRLRNWIIDNFPYDYDLYIELFSGAAWVYFAIGPVPAVLNDINNDIYNFFNVLRDPVKKEKLLELLKYTPYSRELFEHLIDTDYSSNDIKKAWKFFIICKASFSGGGDVGTIIKSDFAISAVNNKIGKWAPTKGRFKSDVVKTRGKGGITKGSSRFISSIKELDKAATILQTAIIENKDFRYILNYQGYRKESSFIYADPPYIKDEKILSRYYGVNWSIEDFYELGKLLNDWPGPVMFSNYDNKIWDDIFPAPKWRKKKKNVCVSAQKGSNKRRVEEIILMNYEPKYPELNLYKGVNDVRPY